MLLVRIAHFLIGAAFAGVGGFLAWTERARFPSIFPPDPAASPWMLIAGVGALAAGTVFLVSAVTPRPKQAARRAAQEAQRREILGAADAFYAERNRAVDRDWRSSDLPPPPSQLPPLFPSEPKPEPETEAAPSDLLFDEPPAQEPVTKPVADAPPPVIDWSARAAAKPSPTVIKPAAIEPAPELAVSREVPPPQAPTPQLDTKAPSAKAALPETPERAPAREWTPLITTLEREPEPEPELLLETRMQIVEAEPLELNQEASFRPTPSKPVATSTPPRQLEVPFRSTATLTPIPKPAEPPPAWTTPIPLHRAAAVNTNDADPFASIRSAIAEGRLADADRLLSAHREKAQGAMLAELTGLAGDHAAAAGRTSNAKWLWRLALKRFGEINAMDTPAAHAVSERLRLADQ